MNNKYVFFLFYCTLFANLTSLYFPLSTHVGLPLQVQGVCYIMSCLLVLFVARDVAGRIFKNPWMIGLCLLVVVIPFFSVFYTPYAQLRDVALVVLFFLLVFATAVSVQVRGWNEIWRLIEITLVVNILGLIFSFFQPYLFIQLFSGGAHEYVLGQGRAPGLFVNGNQSAKVLTILTVAWLAMPRNCGKRLRLFAMISFSFVAIAMTGSRSSLLVYSFLAAIALIHYFFARTGRKFNVVKVFLLVGPLMLPVMLAGFILALKLITPYLADEHARGQSSLTARLQTYAEGPAAIYEDFVEAAEGRFNVSAPYWYGAKEKPFLGHGVRSMFVMRHFSGLELISHNTFVTFAYEYGFPYMVVFLMFLLFLLRLPFRQQAEAYFAQSLMLYFVVVVILFYMTIGTGHELRPIWIVLGGLVGLMVRPPAHLEKQGHPQPASIRR